MHNTKTFLTLCLLAGSIAAQAQIHKMERRDSLPHAYNLNPVVVTGSGHHQRLKQTATPVHVLSAQEIREQGISTFDQALTRMMPQISMAPNSMGSQLRLNGLGNKYILILINGQKLSGDISNNVDLNRINMARVKRIEVLDGAASSLYGSDAIAGVINIITDQPTVVGHASERASAGSAVVGHASERASAGSAVVGHASERANIGVTSATRVSGHGQLTENVGLDIYKDGFGSYTSFSHDRADSYRNNPLEYKSGSDTETQLSIAPLFTGYRSNVFGQKFTFAPTDHLALNAGLDYSYKITDRPATVPAASPAGSASSASPTGGTDYEMRYKGLRWTTGFIYKFDSRNSLMVDYTVDRFRYGKEYDVATEAIPVGTYIQSKKQRTIERQVKAILGLLPQGTTIVGNDWQLDKLVATSGNINQESYILAYYAQHEQRFHLGSGTFMATLGARYNYHKTFGNHFVPKASLMYSLGPVNVRATYSTGFRAPGLDELYYHYFSVNRGKAQISFGNQDLSPEKSHYLSLNAEYRSDVLAVSLTGYVNRINDMVVKQNVDVDDDSRKMLLGEFPEMTQEQADKMVSYALYQNSDRGDVKGAQLNVSANLFRGFNLSANYAYTYARSQTAGEWTVLERSIRNAATIAANYHHTWGCYALNVNINGQLQSKTYYTGKYENAPGYGIWNLHTTHTFTMKNRKAIVESIEPSLGIDNLFDRVDRRIDSSTRKYALYSPGRMVVAGLKIKL